MAALITERNARTLDQSEDGNGNVLVTASRVFDVTGVADAIEAAAAMESRSPDPIALGSPHPQNATSVITSIQQSENTVAGMWTYTVSYSSKSGASVDGVLLEPPVISIKPYRYIIMSDKDANDVPYVNTAGFPFEGGTPVERRGLKWTYSRWEETYPWATDFSYGGKTNSNVLTLPGIPADIPAKLAKFEGVEQGERSAISPVVRVKYCFDIRETGHTNDVIDQGSIGWCSVNDTKVPGLFVANGRPNDQVGTIRLGGDGRSIGDFQVAPAYSKAYDSDFPPDVSPSEDVINDDLSTDDLKVLSFAQCKSVAMSITL